MFIKLFILKLWISFSGVLLLHLTLRWSLLYNLVFFFFLNRQNGNNIKTNWRYDPRTCWTILSNCLMNLKNTGDSTGFEPMTSAMPVQCSNELSYEVTQLRAGQFVGLMFSRERNVVWEKCYMKCGVWNQQKIWPLHLLDNFKQLSHEPEKFRWLNGIRTHDLCDAGAVL